MIDLDKLDAARREAMRDDAVREKFKADLLGISHDLIEELRAARKELRAARNVIEAVRGAKERADEANALVTAAQYERVMGPIDSAIVDYDVVVGG